MRCWPRVFFTSANTPCSRPSSLWQRRASRFGYERLLFRYKAQGARLKADGPRFFPAPCTLQLGPVLIMSETWLNKVNWSVDGLVTAVVQDAVTGRVLMVAWMDRDALKLTWQKNEAVYWSRSRKKLWHKGEESGHFQKIKEIRLDCDGDVILLQVEQQGGIACHTGRESCFYSRLEEGRWVEVDPILKSPEEIYKTDNAIKKKIEKMNPEK